MIPAKENLIQFLIFNLIFAMLKPINKHRAIRLHDIKTVSYTHLTLPTIA